MRCVQAHTMGVGFDACVYDGMAAVILCIVSSGQQTLPHANTTSTQPLKHATGSAAAPVAACPQAALHSASEETLFRLSRAEVISDNSDQMVAAVRLLMAQA